MNILSSVSKNAVLLLVLFFANGCTQDRMKASFSPSEINKVSINSSPSETNRMGISFWPTDVPPPPEIETHDHPCGQILTIQSTEIPKYKNWLEPDIIYEIDENGVVLRTWLVPIDHYPVGVERDAVLLAYGSSPETVMSVTTSGHIGEIPSPPAQFLETTECPPPYNEKFYCSILPVKPVRMLASKPPCT